MRKAVFLSPLRLLVAPTLLLLGGLLWSACERPFIEPTPPALTILEPDFSTALVDAETMIRVEASSFRDVEEVRLNGQPLAFQPDLHAWEGSIALTRGLNVLRFETVDAGGVAGTETVYALRMPFVFGAGPTLPSPRGGHTTTLLNDGSLLITGGVARAGGPLRTESLLLPPGSNTFITLAHGLNEPRTGHTATLLADGRVLILGGSRTDDIRDVSDLVETAEIYDPDTRTFTVVPVEGEPIRRTLHTAALRSNTIIDLYGGQGDIRYTPEPRLGIRSDLRTLIFEGGTIEPFTNLLSAPKIEPLAGHTQTLLREVEPGDPGQYLIAGSFFDEQGVDDISFQIDFSRPNEIFFIDDAPLLKPSRTRHAAVLLQDGYVAYFGGIQDSLSTILDETVIYAAEANQFFRLPRISLPIKRYGHTATKLSSQRILLLGGFTISGNSLGASEFFDPSLPN